MTALIRRTAGVLAALMATAGGCACAATLAAGTADGAQIERGRYLAVAGDCASCHTAPGGRPYAGGLPLQTPVGAIYSTNITPSKADGIGSYTLLQFSDALRKGIRGDGRHLYPAMPYTAYAQLTDGDVRALYAYFMHGVQPVNARAAQTRLPFPFNIRLSMSAWNLLFLDRGPFTPDPHRTAEWNRGAYLVRGLTHCGTCHTPRNLLMAEEPSRALAGGKVDTWEAPNITPDPRSGIGNWSAGDLVAYLHSGLAPGKAQAAGPMAEAIDFSLRHLTQADLLAIAAYLKAVPARHDPADTRPVDTWGAAYAGLASIRGHSLPEAANGMTGPQLYDAYCATCHQDRGQGSFDGGLPPLFHNTATGRSDPDNLVMVMLEGIRWRTDGSGTRMPGFGDELSDRQVATLGNYLTRHFGDPAATVTAARVAALRAGGAPTHLVLLARILVALILLILALIVAAIVIAFARRHRRATGASATH